MGKIKGDKMMFSLKFFNMSLMTNNSSVINYETDEQSNLDKRNL